MIDHQAEFIPLSSNIAHIRIIQVSNMPWSNPAGPLYVSPPVFTGDPAIFFEIQWRDHSCFRCWRECD